jgi:hypothetical protein
MSSFDVRLFKVPRPVKGQPPVKPTELDPMKVRASSIDKAKRVLVEKLQKIGYDIRSVQFGPNAAGKPSIVAYIWEQDSGSK